ncbi:MAG: secretion protein HlyD, partial [Pirellulaceae bacterium]
MKLKFPSMRIPLSWIWTAGLIVAIGVAFLTIERWWPRAQSWVQASIHGSGPANSAADPGHEDGSEDHAVHDHAGHEHAHAHDDANSLELSAQAMGNIGLTARFLRPVQLETYRRAITVPAIIVERPGRTRLEVSTPMAGVITHVHAVRGEATEPGALLFEIRITADELVATQTEMLKTIGDLDVENREIARYESVTSSGAVPLKALLERQYARDK